MSTFGNLVRYLYPPGAAQPTQADSIGEEPQASAASPARGHASSSSARNTNPVLGLLFRQGLWTKPEPPMEYMQFEITTLGRDARLHTETPRTAVDDRLYGVVIGPKQEDHIIPIDCWSIPMVELHHPNWAWRPLWLSELVNIPLKIYAWPIEGGSPGVNQVLQLLTYARDLSGRQSIIPASPPYCGCWMIVRQDGEPLCIHVVKALANFLHTTLGQLINIDYGKLKDTTPEYADSVWERLTEENFAKFFLNMVKVNTEARNPGWVGHTCCAPLVNLYQ